MLIANPIYDTIFKYLLEDTDIAKKLIGLIIDEEICSDGSRMRHPIEMSAKRKSHLKI